MRKYFMIGTVMAAMVLTVGCGNGKKEEATTAAATTVAETTVEETTTATETTAVEEATTKAKKKTKKKNFRKLNQIRGMCRMFTNMDLFSLNLSFQTFHKLRKNLKRKNYRTNKEKVIDFFF